jgi:hypothetical protein
MGLTLAQAPYTRKLLWERYLGLDVNVNGPYALAAAAGNCEGFSQVDITCFWEETTVPYVTGQPATLGVEFSYDGAMAPASRGRSRRTGGCGEPRSWAHRYASPWTGTTTAQPT